MLTPTHLITGQTTFLLTSLIAGHAPSLLEAVVAASSALIPDIDTRQSYFGRLIKPVSGWFEDTFGHRTLTHSLFAQVSVGFLAYFILPFGFFLALIAGWVSHTFADMMTPSGKKIWVKLLAS